MLHFRIFNLLFHYFNLFLNCFPIIIIIIIIFHYLIVENYLDLNNNLNQFFFYRHVCKNYLYYYIN